MLELPRKTMSPRTWVIAVVGGLIAPLHLAACTSSGGTGTDGAITMGGSTGTAGATPSSFGGQTPPSSGGSTLGGTGSSGSLGGSISSGGNSTGGSVAVGGNGGALNGGTSGGKGPSSGGSASGGSAGASGNAGAAASATAGAAGTAGFGGSDEGSCPTSATLKAGDTTKMIMTADGQRSFLVHAPPSYDGKKRVPVVFDFHGLSGNGAQQKSLSRFDRVADAQGFLVVYPDGLDKAWNAGLCCTDKYDDVAFVRAIIKALQADACIDGKRVYASGCSNGGGMSYKLACEAADVIAAVAPVDFDCVDGSACMQCSPARPISVVQFRGTSDQLVAYEGSGAFVGAKANFAKWGELNMCTGAAAALPQHDGCQAYPMCASNSETILCTVQNGMHCGNYSSFKIADVAWEVLQRHTLP